MNTRFKVWAAPTAVAALALGGFQLGTHLSRAQPPINQNQPLRWSDMTPEQKKAYDERNRLFRESRRKVLENDYQPKSNNGSKRQGLTLEQLPVEIREKASELADQYKQHIYPALALYAKEHEGRLPNTAVAMDLLGIPASYTADEEYKGTGLPMHGRGSWSIGDVWRLDGTLASRDLYSKDSDSEPHDVWAQHTKFENTTDNLVKFRIRGWDDGKVTFDNIENDYYAITQRPYSLGSIPNQAAPGQAGIPPEAVQGLKKWHKSPQK